RGNSASDSSARPSRKDAIPSCTSAIAFGLTNVAVPTWTAVQPATKNSSASSARAIPPIPITGMRTERAACWPRCRARGRRAVQARGQLSVLRGGLAVDVDEHREIPLRPSRRVIADQGVHAWPLQADRVQHPARRFGDAWRGGALPRTQEDAFRNHRAQRAPL